MNIQSTPEIDRYVAGMIGKGIEFIQKEPDRMKKELNTLNKVIKDLAFENYTTFMEASDVSEALTIRLASLERAAEDGTHIFPKVEKELKEIQSSSVEQLRQLRQAVNNLQIAPQITKLIEAPRLLSDSINSMQYFEAIEYWKLVQRFETLYDESQIVRACVDESNKLAEVMLEKMLSTLESDIELPEILQLWGFIRKHGKLSEIEIQSAFLERRRRYLQAKLDQVKPQKKEDYVRKPPPRPGPD